MPKVRKVVVPQIYFVWVVAAMRRKEVSRRHVVFPYHVAGPGARRGFTEIGDPQKIPPKLASLIIRAPLRYP